MKQRKGLILLVLAGLIFSLFSGCYSGDSLGDRGQIRGTVTQSDGTPAAGAKVSITGGGSTTELVADASGLFEGYFAANKAYALKAVYGTMQSRIATTQVLKTNGILIQDLVLVGTGTLQGRVNGSDGNPISGAVVQVKDADGNVVAEGASTSTGEIRITDIPEGIYTVVISSSDGSLSAVVPNVVISGNSTTDIGSVVALGGADNLVSVNGVVLGFQGSSVQELAGARIQFKNMGTNDKMADVSSGTNGVGGGFVAQVTPGSYAITFSANQYFALTLSGQSLTRNTQLPAVVLIALSTPTGGVKGRVLVGTTPQDGVRATVVNAQGYVFGMVQTALMGNGEFSINGLPSGNYTLKLEGASVVAKEIAISITAGQITDLGNIQCGANAGLKGTLKDQNGSLIENATVILKDSTGKVVATVSSDAAGNFVFENIPVGTGYVVEVSKPGYDTLILNAGGPGYAVDAGFYTQVTSEGLIFYASLGEVKLTVRDSQVTPAVTPSGLSIALGSASRTTNASGQAVFAALESGKAYDLVFSGNALYEGISVNTGLVPTKKTSGDVVEKTLNLIRKKAVVSGNEIKFGDTGGTVDGGYVKICNEALLPEVNGEHCVTVPIVNGSVSIPDLPFGGGYTVTVHYSDDYNDLSKTNVTLDSASESLADLIGGALVFTPGANAKTGIKITVQANDGGTLSEVSVKIGDTVYKTNSSGVAETGNTLPLGSYSVVVNENSGTNWKYGAKTLTIAASKVNELYAQTVTVDRRTSNLTVTVKRQDNGAALGGASVTLGAQSVTANGSGVASFTNVKYDEYALSASLNGYVATSQTYKNTDGTSKEIRLMLDSGVKFKITANGVQNGDVLEVKAGASTVKTVTASSDAFDIADLVAGTYTVTAKRQFFNDLTSNAVTLGPDASVSFSFNEAGNGTDAGSRKKGSLTGKVALNDPSGENLLNVEVALRKWDHTLAGTAPVDAQGNFSFATLYQGNYTLVASYEAYGTVNKAVTVVGSQDAGTLTLSPLYASVSFNVSGTGGDANGALVSFNGVNKTVASGQAAFAQVKKGTYAYTVSKTDYVGTSGNVTLAAEENKSVSVSIASYGTVKGFVKQGTTLFAGASVIIKNAANQTVATPSLNAQAYLETKLPAGKYTIEISNLGFGYENLADTFTLAAGETYDLQLNWNPSDDGNSLGSGSISTGDSLSPYTLSVTVKDGSTNLTGTVAVGGNSYSLVNGAVSGIVVQKGQTYTVSVSGLPLGYSNASQNKTIAVKSETLAFSLTAAKITLKSSVASTFKIFNSSNQLTDTKAVNGTSTFNVTPGSYKVEVSAAGYITQVSGFKTAGQVTFDYTGGAGSDGALLEYASVSGLIQSGGAGVSGVAVSLGGVTVYTDASGSFTITGLIPGNYTYEISKAGYQTVSGSKNLTSGGNTLNTVSLVGLGSISGRVMTMAYCDTAAAPKRLVSCNVAGARYNASAPVSSAFIRLTNTGGQQLATATTNAQGNFSINGPEGTNYSIKATKSGFWDGSRSGLRINVGGSENIGDVFVIDAELLPPDGAWTDGIVTGKIVNAVTGRVINDRAITVEIRNGGANGDIVLKRDSTPAVAESANGTFTVGSSGAGLVPGKYYTVVLKDALGTYQSAAYDMVIVDGTTNVGTLAMTPLLPAGELRVTLRWQSDGYDYNAKTATDGSLAEQTRDLDSHLVGPAGSNFHIWYAGKKNTYAWLDIDDTVYCTKNGETITINSASLPSGTYSYTIHNYAKNTASTALFSNSNAVVVVYDSKGILAMQSIEPNTGSASNGWKVFELVKNADGSYRVNIVNTVRLISSWGWGGDGSGVRSSKPSDLQTIEKAITATPKN